MSTFFKHAATSTRVLAIVSLCLATTGCLSKLGIQGFTPHNGNGAGSPSDAIESGPGSTILRVTGVSSNLADGSYNLGDTIDVRVTFSDAVDVIGIPTITVETGATDRVVNYTSGTGTTELLFSYVVQAGDTSADLDYVAINSLTAGTSIKGATGTDAVLTLPSPGAANSLGSNKTIIIDTTNPTVSSVSSNTAGGTYNTGDVIDIRVTFSELVNVVGTPTITVETGGTDRTVDYSSGTGSTVLVFNYTVQAGDTSADLDYVATTSLTAGTSIRDAAANNATLTLAVPAAANSLGANEALVIDSTAPTVSSVSSNTAGGTYNTGDVIDIRVTFSELVNVVGTPTITVETGGTDRVVNYASGTGSTVLVFNYTVQAGDVSADLDYVATTSLTAGTTIRDAGGTNATLTLAAPGAANSLGNNEALVIDGVVPTVSSVSSASAAATYNVGDVIDILVTFSEAVTVVGTPTITVETGATDRAVNYASGSPGTVLTFNYTVQAGDVSADLDYVATTSLTAGTSIRDAAGNDATRTLAAPAAANSLGNNEALVIDGVVPTVSSVTSNKANNTYTVGEVIDIRVIFSEIVNVVGTPTIQLETGTTDQVIDYASGTGSTVLVFNYTVQAGDSSGDLDYKATTSLTAGTSIRDAAGNDAVRTLASPGAADSLGNNKVIVIDTGAPTVSSVSSNTAGGTYNTGDVIDIRVTFSEIVNVVGTPTITVETGAADRAVNYASGTGSTVLVFSYTVQAGDVSADLDYVATTSLTAGTTIRDASLNDATLTLPAPAAANSLGNNAALVIDGVVPTVSSVSSATAAGSYNVGDVIDILVTFSEAVTVVGTPTITVETGATDRVVNYTSGSPGTVLTFNYTVQAGDTSADLDYVATTSLTAGTTIRDAAGNDATRTLAAPGAAGSLGNNEAIVIDSTVPTVSSVSSASAAATYNVGDVIDILVTFSEAVTVVGTPTITVETGATDRVVDYVSGSPGTVLTFNYTVQAGDVSADLDYVATTSLTAGTTIRDAAGNDATRTLAAPGAANSLGNNEALVIDGVVPTVSSVSSASAAATYNVGDVIDILVTFSEAVTVVGTPTITVETGAVDRAVNYVSGSPGTVLTFNYTVQAGDVSADLDYVATTSLTAGTTIRDAAGNDATRTLAAPGAANSLGNNEALVIDGVVPTVSSVSSATAAGSYNAGDVIDILVTFSEAVTVVGTPTIEVETGGTDRTINYVSGSPGTVLTFNYTVQAGDTSADLDYKATNSLTVGTTIRDAAGNDATLTLAAPAAANSLGNNEALVIDTTAPTVSSVSSDKAAGTYSTGEVINIHVTFSENVTVAGTPTITLETGAADQAVNYTSGSTTTILLFTYTVQAGDVSADLDYVATTSLTVGTTIRDAAGNNATLTLAAPAAAGSLGANEAIVLTLGAADPSELLGFQIATGDFDRDGDMDVVVPSLTDDEVVPYLNNGAGVFAAGTAVAVGVLPVAVTTGDFNRDGKLDIAVSNWTDGTVSFLMGVGDGTFGAAADVTVGTNPAGLAVLDINKDGDLDVVVANYGDDTVQLISNNGAGVMAAGATTATGDGPTGVVAADFDLDGDKDIAVTNWSAATVSVLATAAGALAADETITVGAKPIGIIAADVNANGKIDIITANYGAGTVRVSLNAGTSFGAAASIAVGVQPVGVVATRWNAGGTLDLIVANSGGTNYSVLGGVGDGTFGAAANTALTGTLPTGVALADYNKSGETDVVFMYGDGVVPVEFAAGAGTTGDGTFTVSQTLSMAAGTNAPTNVSLADMDNDGDLDLITGQSNLDAIYVSLNNGSGTMGALTGYAIPGAGSQGVAGLSVGDFNGDGDTDVIAIHGGGVALYTVFANDGAGALTGTNVAIATRHFPAITPIPADIDRDGDLDFVASDTNNGTTIKFVNNGSASFTATDLGFGSYGMRHLIFGDLNGDAKIDLGLGDYQTDDAAFTRSLGDGAAAFAAPAGYTTDASTNADDRGVDFQDFDSDGDLDAVVINFAENNFAYLANNGSAVFAAPATFNAGASAMVGPTKIASGDFDSDGDLDVAIASKDNDYVYIFVNNGSGAFTYSDRVAVGTGPANIVVGDLNKDGKLDWVVPNSGTGNPSTLSIGLGD